MPNLNSLPQHVAHLPRTGFDMGQSFGFTMSTGMLLPCYQDYLNPGESVYINSSMMARTQPMVSPAMVDVDFYIDWFFVPMPMIYTAFPSVRWQTNDFLSSFFDNSVEQPFENYPVDLPIIDINHSMYGEGSTLEDISFDKARFGSEVYNFGGLGNRFDCIGKSVYRLADHLGYVPDYVPSGIDKVGNPNVFPVFPAAYQAIYQNYYRQDERERRNISCYNLDRQITRDLPSLFFEGLFQLRYRPYRLDYFTSVKAAPIINPINLTGSETEAQSSSASLTSILTKVDSYLSTSDPKAVNNYGSVEVDLDPGYYPSTVVSSNPRSEVVSQVASASGSLGVGTAQLRSMFAVEKLLRITGHAKKDYDSQVLAHFGFKVPHDVKHELTHIVTQHGLLHIGEVVSTSDTYDGSGGSSLGELSGRGYLGIKPLMKKDRPSPKKFTAPCDGVIMAIVSCVPRPRYYGGFDKQNGITDRLKFYQPEFDRLGMQPLFWYESNYAFFNTPQSAGRLGWQYRYEQFKRKYDRVSMAFASPSNGVNNYSSWVYARRFGDSYSGTGDIAPHILDETLCPPTALNDIMIMPYNTAWSDSYNASPWLSYAQDPFICDFRANVKKVSYMSSTGEPMMSTL